MNYTMEDMVKGYKEMWEINQNIADDVFNAEVEAEFNTYEKLQNTF